MIRDFYPSEQAQTLLKKRYLKQGEDWQKLCRRVAHALARSSQEEEAFFTVMVSGKFLPNTPCLINAGTPYPMMSACFVLPVGDSINEIFDAVKNTALIHQRGGGTGFNFSELRPEGSMVKTTGGVSSGPVSFMKVFDAATAQMKQGGVRRGANMGLLMCDHPDIAKFIRCKHVDKEISNFNISVGITSRFMKEVRDASSEPWPCRFGYTHYVIDRDTFEPRPLVAGAHHNAMTATELWDMLCTEAWRTGEPGVVFMDTIKKHNGDDIIGVNPCGEQPLEAYEACCLGSIDVSKFVDLEENQIDIVRLLETVCVAIDMLNRVIDCNVYPIPQIDTQVKKTRKIGLGIMGWADALIKLKIRYGSEKSLALARQLMRDISEAGKNYSNLLKWDNTTITTIAPTGSISLIAGCSSGIEPVFSFITKHHRPDLPDVTVLHPLVQKFYRFNDPSTVTYDDIDDLPKYFVEAKDITPEEHVKMQAAFQEYTHNAVSKTINLPAQATVEDVKNAYMQAYDLGCKGITVYRDGSRANQVLTSATKKDESAIDETLPVQQSTANEHIEDILSWEEYTEQIGLPEERPYCLESFSFKIPLDMGGKVENTYITVGVTDKQPYEVFVNGNVRDADPVVAQYIDTTTRLISLSMRGGIPLVKIIEQLEKVPSSHIYSVSHKIAQVLKEFLPQDSFEPCPECGGQRVFAEGCEKCVSCGWARCG
ncbi:MAG: adenosylcobalamin-dependent ribonucleoside-diphosphate reductase [Thermoplasmata archaeon]|mgnify:CR=1 FL=1|nr:MAG: adenosylcobalamin-dependent ribonucleoside-diphosphate reductase [Thermoplasmata archaeon]